MLAYFAILFTALGAFLGAPVWTALIGASALFAISYSEQRKFAARFARFGATNVLTAAHWQSAGHALAASLMAFAVGKALNVWLSFVAIS